MEIHDTGGDDHFQANQNVTYQSADVFMILVATDKTTSFDHIEQWKNRIQRVEPDKPIILILTKIDLSTSVRDKITY